MPVVLAVDGGQMGCRLALSDGSRVLGIAAGGGVRPGPGSSFAQLVCENVTRALEELRPLFSSVDTVCLGLSGFGGSAEVARDLNEGIRGCLETGRLLVTNDAVTSYVGAVGFEPAVVVAAGTGAITMASDGHRRVARVDGWGYVLGDAGSGYEIGRRGLVSALRAFDGRGGSEELRRRAERSFGPMDGLSHRIYGEPGMVAAVAGFAGEVAAAAGDGDRVALSIWEEAGRELALSAAAAARTVFAKERPVTVSWTGRLFDAGELLLGPFRRNLEREAGNVRLVPPAGTALDGALRLSTAGTLGAFGPLVHLFEAR